MARKHSTPGVPIQFEPGIRIRFRDRYSTTPKTLSIHATLAKIMGAVFFRAALTGLALVACGGSPPRQATLESSSRSPSCDDPTRLRHGGQFLTMPDGVRVWYKLAGRDGAPVVAYLHGGPGYNAYAFEKSAGQILEESVRMLYIDQRGCGRSGFDGPDGAYGMRRTVEDVERIRVAIGAESLGLIGHSFGGIVAAAYAHRFPKNVSGIVMVDTAPRVGRAIAHQIQFLDGIADTAFPEKAAQIHTAVQTKQTAFATLLKLYEVVGRVPLQRRMHYASTAKQAEMETLDSASAVMGCTSERIVPAYEHEGYLGDAPPDVAARLTVPSLLLAGRSSEVIGKENLEAAAQIWGARLLWVDGAGHFVYFEKPREFTDAVTRFFAAALAAPVRFDAPKVDENEFPVAPSKR